MFVMHGTNLPAPPVDAKNNTPIRGYVGTNPGFSLFEHGTLFAPSSGPSAKPYFRRMQMSRQNVRTVFFHVFIWVGFAIYEQAIIIITNPWKFDLLPISLNYLLNALFFYLNSYVLLPRFYARKRYWSYIASALLLLSIYAFLRNALYLNLTSVLGLPTVPTFGSYWQFLLLSGYRGTFFLFVSIGYWFAHQVVALETQKRKHEQLLRTAERSAMEAKLAALRNQINPHFLFNSLNFLYAQVYPLSQDAARGILLLSDTMRYALNEDNSGKVMLTQEVKHLHNYIAINQLRFNNQLQIYFKIEGNLQFALIPPLVLITFVENCFKHGELGDPANPLVVDLSVVQNRLTFRTHNKKRTGPKEKSTGIGLANTCERLAIVYPDRYTLKVENSLDYYTCNLTIDL